MIKRNNLLNFVAANIIKSAAMFGVMAPIAMMPHQIYAGTDSFSPKNYVEAESYAKIANDVYRSIIDLPKGVKPFNTTESSVKPIP